MKTKSSRRCIALGSHTIQTLRDHYERQQSQRVSAGDDWVEKGLIFTNSKGGSIYANHMVRVYKDLLKLAGVPEIRFHDVRHTAASLMISHGIPPTVVARRLRH